MDIEKNSNDNIKKLKRRYLKKIIHSIIGLISAILGTVFCFIWYDWKLFVIISMLAFANNISQNLNKDKN